MPDVLEQAPTVMLRLFDYVEGVQCWIKNAAGVYLWINRGFLLNYSLEGDPLKVVGKTDYDLSPKHLADQYVLDDQRVLAGEVITDRLELVGRYDHLSAWCWTTKLPIHAQDGSIIGTAGITRVVKEADLAGHPNVSLAATLTYIREHYADSPTNADLAKVASRSERSLERLFVKELHMSPQQYLRRVRVRLSCHDLVYSHDPIGAVSQKHGFCDQSHFTREFREETGLTPKAYRLLHQTEASRG